MKMNINRKKMTLGLIGLGLVGTLTVGGVVAAQAATERGTTPPPGSGNSQGVGSPEFGHMAGMGFGQNSPMTAAAKFLGLSRADLQDQLQSGKSLAGVAGSQGKSNSGLEDAMVAALESNLDSDSALTSGQKAAVVAHMKSRIEAMMTATHARGDEMGMGVGFGAGAGMHAGAGTDSDSTPGMGSGMAAATRYKE